MSIIPVIIAGGSGSRLWPLSSKKKPKPFISLFDGLSLFQKTLMRIAPFLKGNAPLVVTNKEFEGLCYEQARTVGINSLYCLSEPCMRNTAPAILAAAHSLSRKGEDPMMLVLPADHVISPFDLFSKSINKAIQLANKGRVVTFGIDPVQPKTCYGYIERGSPLGEGFTIASFKEKPSKERAQEYIDSGKYFWNSGIFLAKASVFLSEMEALNPEMLNQVVRSVEKGVFEGEKLTLSDQEYEKIKPDSIDYALMEKTKLGALVPTTISWSDIGTWNAYWQYQEKDASENVLEGSTKVVESSRCLFVSEDIEITGFGLENIVAIANGNQVMITTLEKAPELKKLIQGQEKEKV